MALSLLAMEGRLRVAIVSAAQRMNPDAQNALLKTLEEPGPGTCIVLCADETGRSCRPSCRASAQLRLAPLAGRAADGPARRRAALAPPAQARALAIAAGGRPGVALRLAGQPDAVARARPDRRGPSSTSSRADRRTRLGGERRPPGRRRVLDAAVTGARRPDRREPPGGGAPARGTRGDRRPGATSRATSPSSCWAAGARCATAACWTSCAAAAPRLRPGALRRFLDRLDASSAAVEAYASPGLVLDVLLLDMARRDRRRRRDRLHAA